MKITVCTLAINEWYQDVVRYGLKNLENYCNTHNYECIIDYGINDTVFDSLRQEQWYKILLIEKILKCNNSDYIVWIDADCQILKPTTRLEYFIEKYFDSNVELIVTQDNNVLNTGVMFIKNSQFNLELMRKIWENSDGDFFKDFHEQTSLAELYTNNTDIKEKIKIIPYGDKDELVCYWANYYPGKNFLLHSARCSHDTLSFMYMMDQYYIYKLDEETEDEYNIRMEWLNNESQCVEDARKLLNGEYVPRNYSARCIKYLEKIKNKNLT